MAGPAALGISLALLAVAPLDAQEAPPRTAEPAADRPLEEPDMVRAPHHFRVGATAAGVWWPEEPGAPALDAGLLAGLEVESRVLSFLGFRLGVAYGRTAAEKGGDTTDVHQFLVDLFATLRLGMGPLSETPASPFLSLGLGSVVHDPVREDLPTRSQGAAGFGGGVELDPGGSLGARAEWRRYLMGGQNLFDPEDRSGTRRSADRFMASLFWKL